MHQVDDAGVAPRPARGAWRGCHTPTAAAQVLLRTAARAMLLSDPDHAPYWLDALP